ncbi:hypothetical protein ALC60_13886, partial [Trachymyrmex zeteki]
WRKRKSGRERGTRRASGERERAGPGVPSRHVPSLRCPAVPIERKSERERRRKRDEYGEVGRERERERERGSVRKRAKRSRSDSLPVATDGQRQDEEPCVAKECIAPVADRGGWPGDSIRGKFFLVSLETGISWSPIR